MSIKDLITNRRGEVASLILIVSMIVATLGVISGSQVVENRIKTATRAAVSPSPLLAQLGSACDTQCQSIGYDFGSCSTGVTCSTGTPHNSFMCSARSACCCGYFPATNTPVPPTATNTPIPKMFIVKGSIKYAGGQGASGIVVKLMKYNAAYQKSEAAQTTSDTNGEYQFANVTEGTYDVEPQSGTIAPSMQTMVLMTSPYTVTVPLFTMSGSPTATNTPIPPATNTPTVPPATNTPTVPPATNTPTTTPAPVSKADLLIERATTSFNIANNLTVTSIIKNAGNAAVNFVGTHSIQVDIMKSGATTSECTSVNTVDIAGLAPNAKLTLPLLFQVDVYPDCPNFNPIVGTKYTVRLAIDPTNVVNESDESNNTRTVDFTQPTPLIPTVPLTATIAPTQPGGNKPDVIVKTSTYSFSSTNGMTMVAGIQNIGTANVDNGNHLLNIELKDPATSPTTVLCETTSPISISNLAPQAIYSHTIFFPNEIYNTCPNFTPVAGKTYKVTLYADIPTSANPNGTVNESNENNNSRSFNFIQPGANPNPTNTPTVPPISTNTPVPGNLPDLRIKTANPTFNGANELNMITTIENRGNASVNQTDIHGLKAEIKDGNTTVCSAVYIFSIVLAPTGSITQPFFFNQFVYPNCPSFTPTPGKTYSVKLTVDPPNSTRPNGSVNESNETNNTKTVSFTQPGGNPNTTNTPTTSPPPGGNKPDLQIPSLSVSYTGANKPIVTVTIKNGGTSPVTYNANTTLHQIKAEIFDGTTPVCSSLNTVDIPNLAAGATIPHPMSLPVEILPDCPTFTPSAGKIYSVTFTLDATGVIDESDESNNAKSVDVSYATNTTSTPVPANKPDLIIQGATPTFNAANELTLTTVIKNNGSTAANATSVVGLKAEVFDNNQKVCNAVFSMNLQIEPGLTITHQALFASQVYVFCNSFTPVPGNTYTIKLTVNPPIVGFPNGQVDESDTTNNSKSIDFIQPGGTTPTLTPTDTPLPGTPTPTPLRAICQDILINGDSAQKYDVIFLPNGYGDYSQFEADVREAISYYKNAIPSGLQSKYNYRLFTNLEKGYMVTTCESTSNGLKYPCWSSSLAKEAMRNCNGDGYVVLHYTPKPSEDINKAAEALAKFGNVKALTLGKNSGQLFVLRYDLSELTKIVSGSIIGDGNPPSLLMQLLERVLQRFR